MGTFAPRRSIFSISAMKELILSTWGRMTCRRLKAKSCRAGLAGPVPGITEIARHGSANPAVAMELEMLDMTLFQCPFPRPAAFPGS
jgi:hypothetical protein